MRCSGPTSLFPPRGDLASPPFISLPHKIFLERFLIPTPGEHLHRRFLVTRHTLNQPPFQLNSGELTSFFPLASLATKSSARPNSAPKRGPPSPLLSLPFSVDDANGLPPVWVRWADHIDSILLFPPPRHAQNSFLFSPPKKGSNNLPYSSYHT